MTTVILAIAALLTSTLSAIIGMAGGMILLAILLLFLPVQAAIPIHACVQLISNGARTVIFLPHVQWRVWALFAVPALFGIAVGRQLFQWMDPEILRYLIAGFILVATYLPQSKAGATWRPASFAIAGALAGTLGMLIGATGPIIAPFFLRTQILKERLIATKALCQFTVHLFKIIAFGSLGFAFADHAMLIAVLGIMVIIGTRLGKTLLGHVSERLFVLLFKTALTLIALKLLLFG